MKRIAWTFIGWLAFLATAHSQSIDQCLISTWDGTIGKSVVTMEFKESVIDSGEIQVGKYYYRNNFSDFILKRDSKTDGWKELDLNGNLTGLLTIACDDKTLSGEWKSPDGKTSLPIRANKARIFSYYVRKLSAVKASVLERLSLGNHQYEIIGIPNFKDTQGLRLLGNTSGIEAINKLLYANFLDNLGESLSCATDGIMAGSKGFQKEWRWKVHTWNNDFVVLNNKYSGYCGGAHPFSGYGMETLNTSTGEREDVSEWLAETYSDDIGFETELGEIISQAYIKNHDDKDSMKCLDLITVSGTHIWPSDDGITFPAFATSYTMSRCNDEITIPYKIISPYLSPLGRSHVKSFLN